MSRVDDTQTESASIRFERQIAQRWYRWLVVAAMVYSFVVILLALTSLLVLLNRPYGGFLWSWDNAHGLYRVDNFSPEGVESLRPADFILAVEEWVGPATKMRHLAEDLYGSAESVCENVPSAEMPIVHYRILRRGAELDVEAPIQCFRFTTLLRLIAVPFSLGLLLWALGVFVYCAGSQQELNLVFALATFWTANIAVMQGANTPGIDTASGQALALTVINPSPILMVPTLYHLIAIVPHHHPSQLLYRTRWLWYALIPIVLVLLGTIRFQLGRNWHSLVGLLDNVTNWGFAFYLFGAAATLFVRYRWIYVHTQNLQARHEVRLIELSVLIALVAIPFMVAQQEPHLVSWLPINPPALLFWLLFAFVGVAYTILRYQVFPRRVQGLNVLVALAVAIAAALIFSPIPLIGAELGFVMLLVALLGISIFWTLPNPLQRTLRRLTSPGTIDREAIERFSADIQGANDLDTLSLVIVQSLETHLELSFAALWLIYEPGVLTLQAYTDQAPATDLPDELPIDAVWHGQSTRLESGILARAGCEIMLPLMVGDRQVGVVGVGKRWTEEVFDETDLIALDVIAYQAALKLNTERQIRDLRLVPLQIEEAQLSERDRIARDLHDSTQAQLTQLVFAMERVRGQLYNDLTQAEKLLDGCIRDVNQAMRELRAILRDLIPERLVGRTLVIALQEHIAKIGASYETVDISLQADPEVEALLPPDRRSALLRICQQALENALLHARARHVRITLQLSHDRDAVEFSIVDDGRGFIRRPTGDFAEKGHLGLYMMESRVLQHGGHMDIESTPGHGSTVKGFLSARK